MNGKEKRATTYNPSTGKPGFRRRIRAPARVTARTMIENATGGRHPISNEALNASATAHDITPSHLCHLAVWLAANTSRKRRLMVAISYKSEGRDLCTIARYLLSR